MKLMILRGEMRGNVGQFDEEHAQYLCDMCREPYVERRYTLPHGGKERAFCSKECIAGYDWYVVGRNCESEQERAATIASYQENFARYVVPTPASVYMGTYQGKRVD